MQCVFHAVIFTPFIGILGGYSSNLVPNKCEHWIRLDTGSWQSWLIFSLICIGLRQHLFFFNETKNTRNVLKLGLELSSISRMSNDCSRGNDFSFIIFVISWTWKIKGTWKRNVLFVGYCILGNGIEGSLYKKGGVLYSLNLSIKKEKIYYR